ncbi:hypothetical protein KIW84_054447, partial [Lathyrus oleraceus]
QKMASQHYHTTDIHWHFNIQYVSNFHSTNQALLLLLCFFATVIFLPAFFLCIHFCHRRFSPQPSNMVMKSPMELQHVQVQSYSTTKSLGMVGAGLEDKKECCICLSIFQDNEKVKVVIECQHVYHSQCLDLWLSAHPSCPLCRASLHTYDIVLLEELNG